MIKSRIFHAVLFECIALMILIPASYLLTEKGSVSMSLVMAGLSLFAVIWNYVYNLIFDWKFGYDRLSRTLFIRIIHSCGFETGLILLTLPVVAYVLTISLGSAFLLEAAFFIFFFIYAIIFNWLYDIAKEKHA
ncbi:PACE efflux transporter [Shewanella surugensis]|uniref:PACE efflux transporter n=1 Tax=Shewanella surugensis TaxID=212020 RepID=A0ABT0LFT9_9GAMM|nr:PACE efflux transporter [Shewanella surugensis]MCL1126554.1 PACE efflux transporter [Shewanella surugensis]